MGSLAERIERLNAEVGPDNYKFGMCDDFSFLVLPHYRTAVDEVSRGHTRIFLPEQAFLGIITNLEKDRRSEFETHAVSHYYSDHDWCGEIEVISKYTFDKVKGLYRENNSLQKSTIYVQTQKKLEVPSKEEIRELLG